MKVILNKDITALGEEGDVKDVAKGYARNYLFPRGLALPYTQRMISLIEGRRAEIEARREQKRLDARGLKEKLDSLEVLFSMPAGANGKLYGAVTSQTIADELAKSGFQIERKRIEITGSGIKSVGKYKAAVKLYENQNAEITVTITAQEIKTEAPAAKPSPRRGRRGEARAEKKSETGKEDKEAAEKPADEKESETTPQS
jgi:large subunit ribosomal protein L9